MISDASNYIGTELNKFNLIMSQSQHQIYLTSFYIDHLHDNNVTIFGIHNRNVIIWAFESITDITFNGLLYKLLREVCHETPYRSKNECCS